MNKKGKIVDIHNRRIFNGMITVQDGIIVKVEEIEEECVKFIMPGLIDSHVHIESSMLTPASFAEIAVTHGTVAVVSDPHEIANVMGIEGVDFMIESGKAVPMKFFFGAPSCVPATSMESSGSILSSAEISELLARKEIYFLAEMMNFPGVIGDDKEVWEKLEAARLVGKPVDGHAPGLSGEDLIKYIGAGISTDHEATSIEEAREKIGMGMKILIREGSAARNLEKLHPLISEFPDSLMLCCDDIHPEMLMKRHINTLVSTLIGYGHNIFDVLAIATLNPILHYRLDVGTLRAGERADFIVVDDLINFKINETWIDGDMVYKEGKVYFATPPVEPINRFNASRILKEDISVKRSGDSLRVIEVFDGELFTSEKIVECYDKEYCSSDLNRDLLKLVVKERYSDKPPVVGFIHGFGLKEGAFAGSIAHDSHNIIAVGPDDDSLVEAINRVIEMEGGLATCSGGQTESLQLNIGGIISSVPCGTIAKKYEHLSERVKNMGCQLRSPFMTLSFMSLLVIPELKLGDRGLFALKQFKFVDLFV